MDKLGQYITQEYGLLKQILHYLSAKELIIAKQVCRAWAEVVEVILGEENKPVWGYALQSRKVDWSRWSFLQTIPKVIFYYMNPSGISTRSDCADFETCPCKYGDDSTELILMEDRIINFKQKLTFGSGCYDFMSNSSCVLLFPLMPGIEVNTFTISRNDTIINQEVTNETLNQLIGNEPVKCLLLYTYKISNKAKRWINSFLVKILDRQGSNTIAIGGGDARKLTLFQGKENCKLEKPLIYIVTFKGDNVTAHSQLLRDTTKIGIDQFMDQMSKDVGPVPHGSERLAFVVKCVNRCYLWKNIVEDMTYEGKKFKEAFPGIPHYGFLGYGEYGANTLASDCIEKKRRKTLQVIHSNTTSFVILTLHNAQQSRKKLQP